MGHKISAAIAACTVFAGCRLTTLPLTFVHAHSLGQKSLTVGKQALHPAGKSYKTMIPTSMHPNRRALSCVRCLEIVCWVAF